MSHLIQGHLDGKGLRFALIASRFNEFVVDKLIEGAIDALERHGVKSDDISLVRVPGSFEIPLAAAQLVKAARFDAVVCLGALIRGDTPHFDYLAAEVTKGIAALGMESDFPVSYGIVTADTMEQAMERSGSKAGNRGFDAAVSAIEMARLYIELKKTKSRSRR